MKRINFSSIWVSVLLSEHITVTIFQVLHVLFELSILESYGMKKFAALFTCIISDDQISNATVLVICYLIYIVNGRRWWERGRVTHDLYNALFPSGNLFKMGVNSHFSQTLSQTHTMSFTHSYLSLCHSLHNISKHV